MISIKKRGIIVFLAVLCSFIAFGIAIPSVNAPIWYGSGNDTGLVGRWSCEGNFNDSSGLNNHGTQNGGVTITRGVKGRACGFDGSNDYINISNEPNFDITGNITITGWIKPNSLSEANIPFIFKNTIYYIWLKTAGNIEWVTTGLSDAVLTLGSGNLSLNVWQQITFTYNGSTKAIYIDGVLQTSEPATGSIYTNNNNVVIGSWTTYFFNGLIDEVRIYNRSLSASEVAALYNTSKSYYLNFKATQTQGLLDETGLVGYWKMDAGTGSNSTKAVDSSGLGNNGTVSGAIFTNEGRFKEAYKFDGVDDYIGIKDTSYPYGSTSRTISAWIKPNQISSESSIFGYGGNADWTEFSIAIGGYTAGGLGMHRYGGYIALTNVNEIDANVWNHVAVVYNGTALIGYVDGQQKLASAASLITTFYTKTGFNASIGRRHGTGASLFNGTIDEVRIYNRSLSASEVAALYNGTKSTHIQLKATPALGLLNETGLVGKWSMNAGDGSNRTNATDISGLKNHGTVTGATFTNEGRFKEGYKFDGSDDYIGIKDTSYPYGNTSRTISAWIKPNQVFPETSIFGYGGNNTAWTEFSMAIGNTAGNLGIHRFAGYIALTNVNEIDANVWNHVAVVYNGTALIGYVDGQQKLASAASLITALRTTTGFNSSIGRRHGTGLIRFNGTIDEVRIYNRSLSASEVAGLYNGSRSNFIEWKAVVG